MHGVGVDVPATWPRNQLHCGNPARTTLVVEPAEAPSPLCLALPAKGAHPDVVWLGGYVSPLRAGTVLGLIELPDGGPAAMTPITIDGEPAREWRGRDPAADEPAVLVVLPQRETFVAIASMRQSIRDAAVASIRVVGTDPSTGCPTRTTAYDEAPRHPRLDRPIDISGAVGVRACHYVAGWLVTTATSMPAAKLRALVRAIDAAPVVTSARAPDDAGCARVDRGPPEDSDDGPVVLRFSFAGNRSVVVVARVVMCTRWQSYLYAGDVERRLTGAVLRTLPPVLDQFPDPDTM